jgi:hypothetical protein
MARTSRTQKSDFITTITDTIASHPRLSAAVAFQMGVLLGQAMNNRTGTMRALRRGVEAAPGAIASALPDFGFFDGKTPQTAPNRRRKTSRRRRRKG